jgi:hypothetical protein
VVAIMACASTPTGSAIGEGPMPRPTIVGIDSAFPPTAATVDMPQPAYAALFLVAPGHSATLLYPSDSATNNQLSPGRNRLRYEIASALVETDSQRLARIREAQRAAGGRTRASARPSVSVIPPSIPTYLLLVTSSQPLVYSRLVDKTAGVSIPNIDEEALNAVAKAAKATLASEPREWAGYYLPVELRSPSR